MAGFPEFKDNEFYITGVSSDREPSYGGPFSCYSATNEQQLTLMAGFFTTNIMYVTGKLRWAVHSDVDGSNTYQGHTHALCRKCNVYNQLPHLIHVHRGRAPTIELTVLTSTSLALPSGMVLEAARLPAETAFERSFIATKA